MHFDQVGPSWTYESFPVSDDLVVAQAPLREFTLEYDPNDAGPTKTAMCMRGSIYPKKTQAGICWKLKAFFAKALEVWVMTVQRIVRMSCSE